MYKSKLQELCQQRQWSLPNYSSTRDGGPDHDPRFKASVLVNGVSFNCPDFSKSSKEAQNQAAKIAFQHFSSLFVSLSVSSSSDSSSANNIMRNSPSGKETLLGQNAEKLESSSTHENASGVKSDHEFVDLQHLYKSQLQHYAQKRSLSLPVYSCACEGSPHSLRFKSTVTVDGETFESPEFFRTLKETEHAAAKVAFSTLSKDGIQEDDCGLYKNLLQDLTRKEGLSIPVYTTTKSGESHVPTFTSTVWVEGDLYNGVAAKTKKQAEINASKVAYFSLKEGQLSKTPAVLPRSRDAQETLECMYTGSHSTITADLQKKLNFEDGDQDTNSAEIITNGVKSVNDSEPGSSGSSSLDVMYEDLGVPVSCQGSSQDGSSSPTTVLECSDPAISKQSTGLPAAEYTLLCNRVRVYPSKPKMKFTKGITLLPISDDKWVAVSLDFPH